MTVSPADLTGTERAVLLVLMAESRPVPNPDLLALGPKLDKPGRDKLNELGLIESQRSGGRFVHELTDRGWRLCRDITSAGPPPRSTGPGKTLYTVLGALHRYLRRADLSLADVFGADDDQIEPTTKDRIHTGLRRTHAAARRMGQPHPGFAPRLPTPRGPQLDAASCKTMNRTPARA